MDEKNKTLRDNFKAICLNIHANLKEFGYADLKATDVEEQVQLLLDGKETKGIIGIFAKDMLIENDLFTE